MKQVSTIQYRQEKYRTGIEIHRKVDKNKNTDEKEKMKKMKKRLNMKGGKKE